MKLAANLGPLEDSQYLLLKRPDILFGIGKDVPGFLERRIQHDGRDGAGLDLDEHERISLPPLRRGFGFVHGIEAGNRRKQDDAQAPDRYSGQYLELSSDQHFFSLGKLGFPIY